MRASPGARRASPNPAGTLHDSAAHLAIERVRPQAQPPRPKAGEWSAITRACTQCSVIAVLIRQRPFCFQVGSASSQYTLPMGNVPHLTRLFSSGHANGRGPGDSRSSPLGRTPSASHLGHPHSPPRTASHGGFHRCPSASEAGQEHARSRFSGRAEAALAASEEVSAPRRCCAPHVSLRRWRFPAGRRPEGDARGRRPRGWSSSWSGRTRRWQTTGKSWRGIANHPPRRPPCNILSRTPRALTSP